MLEFKRLDKDFCFLSEYFNKSEISFCDLSVGVRFMWREDFNVDFCIDNDVLFLKESTKDYKDYFYYPISKSGDSKLNIKSVKKLEEYCLANNLPLNFCCIDNKISVELSKLYQTEITNDRDWSDYIYDAQSFKEFSGKKYSGQRNHINKFKKLYPNFSVKKLENGDIDKIFTFLTEFEAENEFSAWTKIEEEKKVKEFTQNSFKLNQKGIYIEVENKVIGFSIGEIVGDTLIAHIEKGLKEYEGVYPLLANEFVKKFANENVKFLNREEDCGDMGLRISKLQYHPIEIKEKNFVKCKIK